MLASCTCFSSTQLFLHIIIGVVPSTTMDIPTITITPTEASIAPDASSDAQTAAHKLQQARAAANAAYHTEQLTLLDNLLASPPV